MSVANRPIHSTGDRPKLSVTSFSVGTTTMKFGETR